jgi:hypothetical protein
MRYITGIVLRTTVIVNDLIDCFVPRNDGHDEASPEGT